MSVLTDAADEICEVVRGTASGVRLLPVAGGTKPALSASARDDVQLLDLSGLRGIVEYDPAELTLTVLAGTPVAEISQALAEHGQYLPFDPPLAGAGATIGGVVAAGVSGAGALRHGGVRDFVIGVRFVDGTGRLVAGGGKVVKNAAGFDFSKLLVGSIGRLGVIAQLSLKVFPQPAATRTIEFACGDTAAAVAAVARLARGPVALDALDVLPGGRVLARIGGPAASLGARSDRLAGSVDALVQVHFDEVEPGLWRDAAEFAWAGADDAIVRVGVSLGRVVELDRALAELPGAQARYAIAGTTAWIALPSSPDALDPLDALLGRLRLTGVVLRGPVDRPLLGAATGGAFAARVVAALDPQHRFLEF